MLLCDYTCATFSHLFYLFKYILTIFSFFSLRNHFFVSNNTCKKYIYV